MKTLSTHQEMTIQPLLAALRSGDRNLPAYLDRLEVRFNEVEPYIMAFVPEEGRFARLQAEARRLIEQYPDEAWRPPLFGLPIGVKDIFHVDGFITRAGSRLPADFLQGPEAECVTLLRQAGALVVGKTITTEFAYFAPGPTRNPRQVEHTPGGSSSGSAAAVAAGLCAFALGTQTIGSINRPAAFCGVVGFKPSHSRISTQGVLPLSQSHDHIGFFTTDVGGAELLAAHLCKDWRAIAPDGERPRLGIPTGPYLSQASPEGLAHFHEDCRRLADAGFSISPINAMPDFEEIRRQHQLLVAAEAARSHAAWFDRYEALYHPKTADLIRTGRIYSDDEVAGARAYRYGVRESLTLLMDAHHIDLWISPSATGPAPRGLDSTGDPVMNLPWTHAGLPALTIPSGTSDAGLPMGLQLAGRWSDDERLLHHGQTVEAALRE